MKILTFVVTFLAALLLLAPASQAAWIANEGDTGTGEGVKNQVEGFIIDGASGFLKSYSDILLLLNESEIGLREGFNIAQAQQLIESALNKLVTSKENYSRACDLIKEAEFNQAWLQRLKAFDFAGLTVGRNLHPTMMRRVDSLLSTSGVAGVYQKIVTDLKDIIYGLQQMRENCQKNMLPGMEDLRTLYQNYSDFMLFGYYSSLVFNEVKIQTLHMPSRKKP